MTPQQSIEVLTTVSNSIMLTLATCLGVHAYFEIKLLKRRLDAVIDVLPKLLDCQRQMIEHVLIRVHKLENKE